MSTSDRFSIPKGSRGKERISSIARQKSPAKSSLAGGLGGQKSLLLKDLGIARQPAKGFAGRWIVNKMSRLRFLLFEKFIGSDTGYYYNKPYCDDA